MIPRLENSPLPAGAEAVKQAFIQAAKDIPGGHSFYSRFGFFEQENGHIFALQLYQKINTKPDIKIFSIQGVDVNSKLAEPLQRFSFLYVPSLNMFTAYNGTVMSYESLLQQAPEMIQFVRKNVKRKRDNPSLNISLPERKRITDDFVSYDDKFRKLVNHLFSGNSRQTAELIYLRGADVIGLTIQVVRDAQQKPVIAMMNSVHNNVTDNCMSPPALFYLNELTAPVNLRTLPLDEQNALLKKAIEADTDLIRGLGFNPASESARKFVANNVLGNLRGDPNLLGQLEKLIDNVSIRTQSQSVGFAIPTQAESAYLTFVADKLDPTLWK